MCFFGLTFSLSVEICCNNSLSSARVRFLVLVKKTIAGSMSMAEKSIKGKVWDIICPVEPGSCPHNKSAVN